jgi:hypothetical protein
MSMIAMMALASLTLTGCGSKSLNGTYSGKDGKDGTQLTFTSGNKVEMNLSGLGTVAGTYVIEGDTLKITIPAGQVYAFTINQKGCLVSAGDGLERMLIGKAELCKGGK